MTTTTSTRGAANDCGRGRRVKINEVESNGGTPGDWVELINTGATAVDVGGFVVKDNDDTHVFTIPAGTMIAGRRLPRRRRRRRRFGLGGPDTARLFAPGGDDAGRHLQLDGARRDDLRALPRRHRRVRDDDVVDQGRGERLPR